MNGHSDYPEMLTKEMADDVTETCPVCVSLTDVAEQIVVDGALFWSYRCSNCLRRTMLEAKGLPLDENGDSEIYRRGRARLMEEAQ